MASSTDAAMVEFIGTFPTLSHPPEQLSDLCDGVALFEALSEIAPEYFDPTTIARHLGDNWALKSSNLRKMVRNMENYFHESLHKDADFNSVNVADIARDSDPKAIANLIELIAAAAVTCPNKGEYVTRIMNLSPEAQVEMRDVLERSLGRLSDYADSEDEEGEENELVFGEGASDDGGYGDDDYEKDVSETMDNRKLFGGANDDIEEQLADARREMAALRSQAALAAEDHEKAQEKLRVLVEDLQDRLAKRQEHLARVEEDLTLAQRELEDTKFKLTEAIEEKTQLADDLDVANAKAQQLHKAEATLVAYKKKLENAGMVNQQMTDLEDQAANYLRQIMDLEAELKKAKALQKQNEDLQEELTKLRKERSNMESSTMSSAADIDELRSRLAAAEKAKKLFEEEVRELRAQQEQAPAVEALAPVAINEGVSKEQREKLMRLEIENQKLQEELEQVKAQEEARSTALASAAASDSGEIAALKTEIQRLQEDLVIKQKENAKISSDKDKLEAYTKRTLAKFQDKYLVALQECKAKLKEKQDKIEALENRSVTERNAQKREERLLSSTIYELGMAIMQARLKER